MVPTPQSSVQILECCLLRVFLFASVLNHQLACHHPLIAPGRPQSSKEILKANNIKWYYRKSFWPLSLLSAAAKGLQQYDRWVVNDRHNSRVHIKLTRKIKYHISQCVSGRCPTNTALYRGWTVFSRPARSQRAVSNPLRVESPSAPCSFYKQMFRSRHLADISLINSLSLPPSLSLSLSLLSYKNCVLLKGLARGLKTTI